MGLNQISGLRGYSEPPPPGNTDQKRRKTLLGAQGIAREGPFTIGALLGPPGGAALGVCINQSGLMPGGCQYGGQVQGQAGFAAAAFLIQGCKDGRLLPCGGRARTPPRLWVNPLGPLLWPGASRRFRSGFPGKESSFLP
jgi:hypothetical protein